MKNNLLSIDYLIETISKSFLNEKSYYHVLKDQKHKDDIEIFLIIEDNKMFFRTNVKGNNLIYNRFNYNDYKNLIYYYNFDYNELYSWIISILKYQFLYLHIEKNKIENLLGSDECFQIISNHQKFCLSLKKSLNDLSKPKLKLIKSNNS